MPFISTNTWVLKIIDGTLSHRMKALGGYALYDEAFAGAREDAFDPATELSKKHAQFLKEGKVWFIKDASSTGTFICIGGYKKGAQSQPAAQAARPRNRVSYEFSRPRGPPRRRLQQLLRRR